MSDKLQVNKVSWSERSWKRCGCTGACQNTHEFWFYVKQVWQEINRSGIVQQKVQIFAVWFCCRGCWMAAWKVQLVEGNKWVKMPCFFLSPGQTGCYHFPARTSSSACITSSCRITCGASLCHQCHPLWQPPRPLPDLLPAATLGSSYSPVSLKNSWWKSFCLQGFVWF